MSSLTEALLKGLYAAQCGLNKRAMQTGEPLVVWSNGEIIKMYPDEIKEELKKYER